MAHYQKHYSLPPWEKYRRPCPRPDDTTPVAVPPEGFQVYKWSGDHSPPWVGDRVFVRSNSIGFARVMSYFTEDGFLGCLVLPENPPEWYVKQNGAKSPCHVFGIEIEPGAVYGCDRRRVVIYRRTIMSGHGGFPSIAYGANLICEDTGALLAETRAADSWSDAGKRLAKRRGWTVTKIKTPPSAT